MKPLSLISQTFQKIIENGCVYADKTRYVYDLAKTQGAYFLSRPRRFGKSLLLSTFKSLFSGPPDPAGPPQGLFADLWIGRESDYDFRQVFPIMTFSMGTATRSTEELRLYLTTCLHDINIKENLNLTLTLPNIDLRRVIERLHEKYDRQVVVLIDEYDAPVSNNIDNGELAMKNGDMLRDFYAGFKDSDEFLRFVFVTGVTRYAFMGLSAGLNQLNDITLTPKYAGICGFTQEELDNCFREHLPVALEAMRGVEPVPAEATVADLTDCINDWYDGYSWNGRTRVLNPFSISLQRTENLSNYHAKIATLERHFQNMPIFNDVLENDNLI
ncbi:MAG: AAA family ATPase, partial [Deltaproteobacteria bacterium]|nr:AAA family ATPase [Deltaproteobacteria bacterium]